MIVFVTGGTRGIGLAMVRALKQAGHTVVTCGRSHSGPVEADRYYSGDITDDLRRSALIDNIIHDCGGLDALVNNAGAQHHAPVTSYSFPDWERQISLMLTTPFVLSRAAARHMLTHGGGQIINVISTSAFQGARYIAGYVAAKHGLLGLTRAMAVELAPLVRVNAIAPGLTQTDMTDEYIPAERHAFLDTLIPAGRFGRPEEMARALLYILDNPYMIGQTVTVDGGWLAKNG